MAEAVEFEDGIGVLGVFLRVDKHDNPNLQPIVEKLSEIHEPGGCVRVSREETRMKEGRDERKLVGSFLDVCCEKRS